MTQAFQCRVCMSSEGGETLQVPEMCFGSGETFGYELCSACGSLQIANVPTDLPSYYPPEYFTALERPPGVGQQVRKALATIRTWGVLFGPRPLYWCLLHLPLVAAGSRNHPLTSLRSRLKARGARIVDVGGGSGELLRALRSLGFRDLTCVDPFLPEHSTSNAFRLLRTTLANVEETFNVVMYHHALEHVVDLQLELVALRDHLSPDGLGLIRLPLLPNMAFDHYRTRWVQIDPPRHIHIPSRRGLRLAMERVGLSVIDEGYDSQGFQFWGSELASRGIPHQLGIRGVPQQTFTRKQIRDYDRRASRLNRDRRGDQGWLLVRRTS